MACLLMLSFSAIHAQITITSPSGGGTLTTGTTVGIAWTDNIPGFCTIIGTGVFLKDNLNNETQIGAFNGSNPGGMSWTVAGYTGSGYKIKVAISVTCMGTPGVMTGEMSSTFSIAAPSHSITVDNSNLPPQLSPNETLEVRWTDNFSGTVDIALLDGTGSLAAQIATNTASDGVYDWVIPYTIDPKPGYKVKVSQNFDESITDQSDAFEIMGKYQFGNFLSSKHKPNTTVALNWQTNITGGVDIHLIDDDANTVVATVISNLTGLTSYNWTVPFSIPSDEIYRFRIAPHSLVSPKDETALFTIPRIGKVNGPVANEEVNQKTIYCINWEDNYLPGNIDIDFVTPLDSGNIVQNVSNTGTYNYEFPATLPLRNDYKIKVSEIGGGSLPILYSEAFSLTKYVEVLAPKTGTQAFAGGQLPIRWSSDIGSTETVAIRLLKDGSPHTLLRPAATNDGVLIWNIPASFTPGSGFQIEITHAQGSASSGLFSISGQKCSIIKDQEAPLGKHYYSALKRSHDAFTHLATDGMLCFKFEEKYASDDTLKGYIYNWQREPVADLALSKRYGTNFYALDLATLCTQFEPGSIYSLEVFDKNNIRYVLRFEYFQSTFDASLEAHADLVNCTTATSNSISYYTNITDGGTAPYMVAWYWLPYNSYSPSMTIDDLRDQTLTPSEQWAYVVRDLEATRPYTCNNLPADNHSCLNMDNVIPNYDIVLVVTDACGREVRKAISVDCEIPTGGSSYWISVLFKGNQNGQTTK